VILHCLRRRIEQPESNFEQEAENKPTLDLLDLQKPEFERFLYASVGADRNGSVVTALSTLARLNLEPWVEAAELAALGREAARVRLGLLLSRFRDVPELRRNHGSVAQDFARLLPERPVRVPAVPGAAIKKTALSWGVIWTVMAVVFFMAQMLLGGAPGAGE